MILRKIMIIKNEDLVYGGFDFDFRNTGTRFENLDCSLATELISLKGCPDVIEGHLTLTGCRKLISLEYAPKEVYGNVGLSKCDIDSYEGIGTKYLLRVDGRIYINSFPKSNMLGFLKIKNLHQIDIWETTHNGCRAVTIINKHLTSGRRLIKCKQELIEAGLKEYAKL